MHSRYGLGLLAAACLHACGYAPMSTANRALPESVRSVYVDADAGPRGDPEFADALERSLRRLVRRDGRLYVTTAQGAADAVLRVELDSAQTRPVAFDEFDDPLDYETTVTIDASLVASDGALLWSARDVGATRAHAAVAGAVVTSSSSFVSSERLRPEDLAAFDTVQLGEQRFTHAREALASDLASAIYLRVMEGR